MASTVVIVDENDQVVGQKNRDDMDYVNDICRVSVVWVTNSSGEVLIAQRKLTKKREPGVWGPSVAGTIEVGESYEQNAYKEVNEELGISDFTLVELAKVGASSSRSYFCQAYKTIVDLPIEGFTLQEDEVEQVQWMSIDKLREDVEINPEKYLKSMPSWVAVLEGIV